MKRVFRIKIRMRRFARRHPWLTFAIRSLMIFSAAFGGAYGIERMFRDARAQIVMAPTSDQAYDFIGRALCGLEVF